MLRTHRRIDFDGLRHQAQRDLQTVSESGVSGAPPLHTDNAETDATEAANTAPNAVVSDAQFDDAKTASEKARRERMEAFLAAGRAIRDMDGFKDLNAAWRQLLGDGEE